METYADQQVNNSNKFPPPPLLCNTLHTSERFEKREIEII